MRPTTRSAPSTRSVAPAVASAALAMPAFKNSRREVEVLVRIYRAPHLPAKAGSYIVANCGFGLQAEAPSLCSIDREREQHVPWHTAARMVPRVEEDHPTANRRARSVQRAASSGGSIDGLVSLDRVVVPHHRSVLR